MYIPSADDWDVLLQVNPLVEERTLIRYCGWNGYTANPTLADLYLGVPDRQHVLERAFQIPTKPCPNCKKSLPRRLIGVKPK